MLCEWLEINMVAGVGVQGLKHTFVATTSM